MGNTVHILPWFLFSSKSILTFFTVDANTQKLQIQTFSKIKASLVDLIAQYKAYKKALGETNLSISDFIKWLISGQAQIDATKLKILALRGAALLLNMALGVVTGLVVSSLIGAITSYAQRIDTAATKTKEAADAANNTTSSLKDLVDAYEELGDKSGWSTEDFDQAKDIQEELLALAKEQGTLDENKANQLDLQNGKYEEQLGLLKDITEEQLKASESKLIQSKDAQGNKLIKTAKDNNRSHFFSSVSANTNRGIMNELKDAGIDVFNKNGSFGAKDLNDPDSIAKYYSELGRALDYIVQNTTEAQRAAGGAYNTVYKYLMDEQSALRDDVDSYSDSTDAVNENVNARRKLQAVDFWQNDNNNSMDVSFTFDKVNSAVQTLEDTIDGFDASKLNELLWGTNEGLSDEQAQALANLRKALTDMDFSADTNGVNAFIQALVQVGIVAQSSANGVDALAAGAQKMEDISSKMDEIQSAYKASTSAMEEYNQYGYMSLDAVSKSKIGSTILGGLGNVGTAIVGGGGKLLAGAGKLITTAGSALAAAGPAAIPIAGAAALGIYGGTKAMKNQKKIWSNKEDGFGKKAIKSVASFFWDISPIGAVVNLCKDIFGKSKETAENTKDTANTSSETAENTKKATGVTNLTINATQGTISEENKTEPVEEKKQSKWDKFWGSKFWFWNWGKKASGDKKIKHGGTYNVDEAGPEMLVRQPASGRYTYLETGDGVVPADITSRLFEMGGNPDKWFSDQLAKNGSASMVQSRSSGGISLSIGDVNVNNPVGDSDALASELVNRLPNRIVQQLNKR